MKEIRGRDFRMRWDVNALKTGIRGSWKKFVLRARLDDK